MLLCAVMMGRIRGGMLVRRVPRWFLPGAVFLLSLASSISFSTGAETLRGQALLKTDILGVFAHPDDETGMAPTLAHYALGEKKVVANVYCTRGEGGGNMVGTQGGRALGILREAELRECLGLLGVRYCHFLDQEDFAYTESMDATLRHWGKEETLGRLVRVIRSLRPEILVTMNPAPTPGQHGHHQSAGLLATEAFGASADRLRFPEQLSKEGLSVWQPRKLYYGGGGQGHMATITTSSNLPNGRAAWEVAGEALSHHRSQAFGNFAGSPWLRRPQTFRLIKSVVQTSKSETDLFEGLPATEPVLRSVSLESNPPEPVELNFLSRPAIDRYRLWTREQGIEGVASRVGADIPAVAGDSQPIKLELRNNGAVTVSRSIRLAAPEGWTLTPTTIEAHVEAGRAAVFSVRLEVPSGAATNVGLKASIEWHGQSSVVEANAVLHPVPHSTVARLTSAPALDGSLRGFETLEAQAISPANLVEGRVADAADSSGDFRLGHHGRTLYVNVEVRDDRVVSNIEPNDIKGHWRSDSVEICIDPVGGAEHTLGCYKLGVFPFDTKGVVRAARDADANPGPIETSAPKTRVVSRKTDTGYRIQASIPFEEIGLKPPQRAGFNVIIYDGDKADAAPGENINKSRVAWAPRPGVQGRPEDWGRIELR